ncbi:MAG: hypothetical protein ACLFWD_08670 [Anaerolineales bacterium]
MWKKHFLFIVLTLALAACSFGQGLLTQTPAEPEASPQPTSTAVGTASPVPITPTLSPEIVAEMEELESQVVELRGLAPTAPIERQLLSVEAFGRMLMEDLLESYSAEEAKDDARLLALFGLLPADFDLWSFYLELYTEQVAGFYNAETNVLYVVEGAEFDGPERLTYVHEYTHALQDQHFDLADSLAVDEEACEIDGERCSAVQAVIEGDASLLEEQWLRIYASQEDFDDLLAFYGDFQSPVMEQAPEPLRQISLFPYEHGLAFVRWIHQRGGWAAVDELFADPPTTTEMILHPLSYAEDPPVDLEETEPDSAALGSNWRVLDQGTLGEFDLRLLLAASLPEERAQEAAEGWGGDYYTAYYNDEAQAGAWYIILQWDTIRDAQDAYQTWRDYGEARFGPRIPDGQAYRWESDQGFARLELASNQTLWLVAPDSDTLEALRQTIEFPAED